VIPCNRAVAPVRSIPTRRRGIPGDSKEGEPVVYIGIGTIVLIAIIVIIVLLVRR